MANKRVFTVAYKRKRKGKTNYKKRLSLLKSGKLRLVIRRSNKHILAQLVSYGDQGDAIVSSAHSKDLTKYGWKHATSNISAAYLVGYVLGKKAKGKEAIVDLGLQSPINGSKLYAVVKGAKDAGLQVHSNDKVFPSQDRIEGKHINESIAKDLKSCIEVIEK